MACPEDCAGCCYKMHVWLYYLEGTCGVDKCTDYSGCFTLIQQGDAGTDCVWLYTNPAGWTITIHCDEGYWWLTIQNGEDICAQWRYPQEEL